MPVYNMFDEVDVIGLIDVVLGWGLPDDVLPAAVNAQLAGAYPE